MSKNIIRPINNNTNKLNMKTIFIFNSNSNVHFSVPFHFENCASVRVAWPQFICHFSSISSSYHHFISHATHMIGRLPVLNQLGLAFLYYYA